MIIILSNSTELAQLIQRNPIPRQSSLYVLMSFRQQNNKSIAFSNKLFKQQMQRQSKTQSSNQKSILYSNTNLTYMQLGELQKTITDLVQQNRKKHANILNEKPEFAYQLYKISEFQAISKAFGKELLLRQLDRLLQEKNYLDRELSLIKFHDEEKTVEKEKMVANQTHHFELLKSIWKKDGSKTYEGTLEHIEELNLMVGQIKCNIQSLIRFQSNDSKQFQQTYVKTFKVLHERNKQCQKCHEYQAKVDYLNLKIEGLQEKLSKISDENITYLQQINSKDDKLKKANKILLKQEAQLKNKIIQLEQDLLKRDQTIKQLKKQAGQQQRFTNSKENFELIIKANNLDLTQYQTQIQTPLSDLIKFITTQSPFEHSADEIIKSVTLPFDKSSSQQLPLQKQPRQFSEININGRRQHEKIESYQSDRIKVLINSELHSKMQEIDPIKSRYIRTGSKRSHRGSISTNNQFDEGSGNTKYNRVALFSKDEVL